MRACLHRRLWIIWLPGLRGLHPAMLPTPQGSEGIRGYGYPGFAVYGHKRAWSTWGIRLLWSPDRAYERLAVALSPVRVGNCKPDK